MVKGSIFLILAVVYGLWHIATRSQRYADALRAQCICCDSHDVSERADTTYTCNACGFDEHWQDDAARRSTVEVMRALTRARDDLVLGAQSLNDTSIPAAERQAQAEHFQLSAIGHLQDPSDLDPSLLEDLHACRTMTEQRLRIEEARKTVRMLLVG